MTIVLAAVDATPSAKPVLGTAVAIAALFEARVIALHVRENGIAETEKAVSAAGIELRVLSGTPVDQIIEAAENREVAALVLRRARSAQRPGAGRAHRARGHHARAQAGRRGPASCSAARTAGPHPRPARW